MNNAKEKNFLVISSWALIFIGATTNAVVNASEYPDLNMQGINYPNSCNTQQKHTLQDKVIKSMAQDGRQAWKAVDLILCALDSDVNRKKIISLFQKKVRKEVESTGDKSGSKTVKVNEEIATSIMAMANAWDTTIIAEQEKIVVQYFVNEACVKSATLSYSNSKWFVYQIGDACD
jgi:hypothetical protein